MPSEELIAQIESKIDLAVLVSKYLPLQESRRALKGSCPFHEDSGLSLMVLPDKNAFKCFGCGKEGGPIAFLSMIENKTYQETVATLSTYLGLAERQSA
ncbi:hypothetical protein IM792_02915 [Mucilaginibacter sp. JRF]|uniref:CHC2 zinc finger domain-containing protein n=1 Tax=Mucilaginibacter sp. JRF TaxID=2780088 RepID=UPI0018825724|nr:CHC2 zinc finger domain-containing protein [Mucilaginibacter sp. JRF]MBE9583387.1 hypothetical protein [Mucilaginibacter sp. JRF]